MYASVANSSYLAADRRSGRRSTTDTDSVRTCDRRSSASASATPPPLRLTAVAIPVAAQFETMPLSPISNASHSRAPHVGQARHNRSRHRSARLIPGRKTTSRYRLTPYRLTMYRLGEISTEPHMGLRRAIVTTTGQGRVGIGGVTANDED